MMNMQEKRIKGKMCPRPIPHEMSAKTPRKGSPKLIERNLCNQGYLQRRDLRLFVRKKLLDESAKFLIGRFNCTDER